MNPQFSEIQIGPADRQGLEQIWAQNIAANPGDDRWVRWRESVLRENAEGLTQTYLVRASGRPMGEGTLIFSPDSGAILGRTQLADGRTTANINALRIEKAWEGQGHISRLVRMLEDRARGLGFRTMTIGVETKETRNIQIYLHWGYCRLVATEGEGLDTILYYAKDL